jgi:hypothetical protein
MTQTIHTAQTVPATPDAFLTAYRVPAAASSRAAAHNVVAATVAGHPPGVTVAAVAHVRGVGA